MEIVPNMFNTDVLRKIMFAVHHLPKDMPNYWKTVKEFASVNESSISELQTVVENMEYDYVPLVCRFLKFGLVLDKK